VLQDKQQALIDLIAGWKEYVRDGFAKERTRHSYPPAYVSFLEQLVIEAHDALHTGTDPADFIRDRLPPLFGGEAPPNAIYGWTEKDVLSYWNQLREWGEVVDRDLTVEVALEILAEAFEDWQVRWEAGNEDLMAAVDRYVEANGLRREQG